MIDSLLTEYDLIEALTMSGSLRLSQKRFNFMLIVVGLIVPLQLQLCLNTEFQRVVVIFKWYLVFVDLSIVCKAGCAINHFTSRNTNVPWNPE